MSDSGGDELEQLCECVEQKVIRRVVGSHMKAFYDMLQTHEANMRLKNCSERECLLMKAVREAYAEQFRQYWEGL